MTRDLTIPAANLAGATTAQLEQALATGRAGYAHIGLFPDRRRTASRACFAVLDELTTHRNQTTITGGVPASPADREEGNA